MHKRRIFSLFVYGLFCLAAMVSLPVLAAGNDEAPAATSTSYDLPYIGEMQTYRAAYEDTLVNIAREHDLGFVEVRAANPNVDPWIPGKGTKIVIPSRHLLPDVPAEGVVINLPEMRLFIFETDADNPLPATHPIGVGRVGLETPMGQTKVVSKTVAPSWRPTARMKAEDPTLPDVVGPGPENPLGTHALYLGWPQYALHGTNKPYGIGRRVSSGCVRLYPEDIRTAYYRIPVGTKVTVVNQPVKAAWIDDTLYIEAHTSLSQADRVEQRGGLPAYEFSEKDMEIILKVAGKEASTLDWEKIRQAIRERRGYPIEIGTRQKHTKADTQPASNDDDAVESDSRTAG